MSAGVILFFDVGGGVSEHALGPHVEDLDDPLRVGCDAGEVGAVEDRALQGTGLGQRLLGELARGVVRADQEVADDGALRVAQGRDGDDRGKTASVLADIGELIDVLDPARRLEHQSLEARRDGGRELGAERLCARYHLLGIGDVGRRDLVQDLGGRVSEHALGPDVEDLDDPFRVGRDAGEVGAVEDRVSAGHRIPSRP
jgi:hypothetical protein